MDLEESSTAETEAHDGGSFALSRVQPDRIKNYDEIIAVAWVSDWVGMSDRSDVLTFNEGNGKGIMRCVSAHTSAPILPMRPSRSMETPFPQMMTMPYHHNNRSTLTFSGVLLPQPQEYTVSPTIRPVLRCS